MPEYTDTQRLDWITDVAARTGKMIGLAGTCYGSVYVGPRTRVAEGDDIRDAIDAAMDAGVAKDA